MSSTPAPPPDPLRLGGRVEVHLNDIAGRLGELVPIEDGLACFLGFSNVGMAFGNGEVLIVDVSSPAYAPAAHEALRTLTREPIRHIVYTHHHGDHTSGAGAFVENGSPEIWAHEDLLAAWRRYKLTRGWQRHANDLQFAAVDDVPSIIEARPVRPTRTFRDEASFELAGERVELRHAKGETDDHCWVWMPERQVALVGDLWVGAMPNAGNPQKVQRYVLEWAEALEQVAAMVPSHVVPGHGLPLAGDRAAEAFTTTAVALRFLHDEVLARLNEGATPAEVVDQGIALPPELAGKPYLRPIYGCVPFVVRDVLRRYAGWWSGDAAELFPARRDDRARDIVGAAGADALVATARDLLDQDLAQRALHVTELLWLAGVAGARDLHVEALEARALVEPSLIGRNLLAGIARRVRKDPPA